MTAKTWHFMPLLCCERPPPARMVCAVLQLRVQCRMVANQCTSLRTTCDRLPVDLVTLQSYSLADTAAEGLLGACRHTREAFMHHIL